MAKRYIVGASTVDTPTSQWSGWVWPLCCVGGNKPVISDGFGRDKRGGKGHFGADIMHQKPLPDLPLEGQTKGFAIFKGENAVCAGPGIVYSSEDSGTGWVVKISHRVEGKPYLSVYRHLKGPLLVRKVVPLAKGVIVAAGTPLGPIGDNPADKNDPPHLHFELWDTSSGAGSYPGWNIDPASVMGPWQMVISETGEIVPYPHGRGGGGTPPVKPDRNSGLVAMTGKPMTGGGALAVGVASIATGLLLTTLISKQRG